MEKQESAGTAVLPCHAAGVKKQTIKPTRHRLSCMWLARKNSSATLPRLFLHSTGTISEYPSAGDFTGGRTRCLNLHIVAFIEEVKAGMQEARIVTGGLVRAGIQIRRLASSEYELAESCCPATHRAGGPAPRRRITWLLWSIPSVRRRSRRQRRRPARGGRPARSHPRWQSPAAWAPAVRCSTGRIRGR